jgi:hypothetical protein
MAEAAAVLGAVEQREQSDVLTDLLAGPCDLLRWRVVAAQASDGKAPLPLALALIGGARKALVAAACDVLMPQSFHPRLSRPAADRFVDQCRVSTSSGSFVAQLSCPLEPQVEPDDPDEQLAFDMPDDLVVPFGRRVTTHVLQASARIVTAIREDREDLISAPGPNDLRVSANLLEALAEMQPADPSGRLAVTASWSRTAQQDPGVPHHVEIGAEYTRSMRRIAEGMRPRRAERGEELFVGKIVDLHREASDDPTADGDVTLTFLDGEFVRRARLTLSAGSYRDACVAHSEQQYVRVQGILRHGARIHRVESVRAFSVMI